MKRTGCGGYMVVDKINGGVPNFRTCSREEVDDKFQKDMHVHTVGSEFFDADLTKPGTQATGHRDNS